MTDDQKKLVEENLNIVFWVIKKYHLDFEEWFGELSEQLCIAAIKWDESRGTNFFSYAVSVMVNWTRVVKNKNDAVKKKADRDAISIECSVYSGRNESDDLKIEDTIDAGVDVESDAVYNAVFEKLSARLSERNRDILIMRMDGYTLASIGKKYHISRERVNQILKEIGQMLERL